MHVVSIVDSYAKSGAADGATGTYLVGHRAECICGWRGDVRASRSRLAKRVVLEDALAHELSPAECSA